MPLNEIVGLVLFAVPTIPLAFALWAWRRDRVRLGPVRRGFGWAALALTTAALVLYVAFGLRMSVVNERVRFPENMHDWALTVARIGFLMATLAILMTAVSIGRTRLLGLIAAVLLWLFYATIFVSV